jgi:hypothetical protein
MDIMPLILFNEKVDRLERCNLTKRMATPHYKIQIDKIMKREWIAFDDVSEDDVDAFVLNLRLLIQHSPRDCFSIKCLSEIYKKDGIPKQLSKAFDEQEQSWENYRSLPSLFTKPESSDKLSNGNLFDIILYGGLAHQNKDKVNDFYKITKQGAFSAFVCGFFLSSLKTILNIVRNIRDINNRLIEVLKK